MTWVIGRAGPFGTAVGISDIRVTLKNGSEVDCLQKIHRIGNQMVMGFAGSVAIGLEVISQLSRSLFIPNGNGAWNPQVVAEKLPQGTKILFDSFPKEQKDLGCDLLLLGADPKENIGPTPWAKCYAYRFYSPNFEPIQSNNGEIISIGSGSSIELYSDALKSLKNDFDMFKLEMGMEGGAGIGLMSSITSVLDKVSMPGISRNLHICIVGRYSIKIGMNSTDIDNKTIATTMSELAEILNTLGSAELNQLKG